MQISRPLRLLAVTVLLLFAIYCALGVLQALSLLQGERALWNVNLRSSGAFVAVVLACLLALPSGGLPERSIISLTVPWLFFGLAAVAAWLVASHLLAVDHCLDRGGSFNYLSASCSNGPSLPSVPLYRTHGFPLVAAGVFLLLGLRSLAKLSAQKRGTRSAA